MRALVISGGGSKGAFAGGVAEYLIRDLAQQYDLFLGTSTGSLLIPHLALGDIERIKAVYTSVNQNSIFKNCPFITKEQHGQHSISINHKVVLKRLLKGEKSFGDSSNLKILIEESLSEVDFLKLQQSNKDVVVTVANISLNEVEYKSIKNFSYTDFIEWIWISCNYPPFMSLVNKNGCDYADGGLGNMVPIDEAIKRGATEIDVIVLETEVNYINRMPIRNPFTLITHMVDFMMDQLESYNIKLGKLEAMRANASITLYYTPTVLTTNSLVFIEEKMTKWWERGYEFAKNQNNTNRI